MPPGLTLPRHRHRAGYATVVLAGYFTEASFAGRFTARPGDVLLHGSFDCHANGALSRRGLQILRLPWFDDAREGHFRVRDADALARLAQRDPLSASEQLAHELDFAAADEKHWSDRLAADLTHDPGLSLDRWAMRENLQPEVLSRGFRRAFGVTPKLFRLEIRTRRAWNAIVHSSSTLTSIAHDFGFADLAHLSRSVSVFTGLAPSAWRATERADKDQLRSSRNCSHSATLDDRIFRAPDRESSR